MGPACGISYRAQQNSKPRRQRKISARLIGMCSRHELSALHGGRYGFSLFARKPIRELLGCSLLDSLAAVELSTEETS
jgi:hypothetical protein